MPPAPGISPKVTSGSAKRRVGSGDDGPGERGQLDAGPDARTVGMDADATADLVDQPTEVSGHADEVGSGRVVTLTELVEVASGAERGARAAKVDAERRIGRGEEQHLGELVAKSSIECVAHVRAAQLDIEDVARPRDADDGTGGCLAASQRSARSPRRGTRRPPGGRRTPPTRRGDHLPPSASRSLGGGRRARRRPAGWRRWSRSPHRGPRDRRPRRLPPTGDRPR